jgi:DNA polymerase I-like protein with 3'-5' exonuclease and polymerase domains
VRKRFWNWIGAPRELEHYSGVTALPTCSSSFIKTKGGVFYKETFIRHIERFAALSSGSLRKWEWPRIEVDNDQSAEEAMARSAQSSEPVGIDIENKGEKGSPPLECDLTCVGFATTNDVVSVTFPENFNRKVVGDANCRLLALAADILKQEDRKKVWQNGGFDRHILRAKGYEVNGDHEDTMDMHSVLHPQLKHSLGFIASSYFHCEAWKAADEEESEFVKTGRFGRENEERFRDSRVYNGKDAYMQRIIYDKLRKELL